MVDRPSETSAGHPARASPGRMNRASSSGVTPCHPPPSYAQQVTTVRELTNRHGDAVLGAVLAGFAVVELVATGDAGRYQAAACAAVAGVGLSLRRKAPVAGFLVIWAGLFGAGHFVPDWADGSIAFLVFFFVSLYSVGAHTRGRATWLAGALVVVGVGLFTAFDHDPFAVGDAVFATFFVGGPFAAGVAIRIRRERERTLITENEEAVARERARIARELHDVVAHAISVTVVQARGGRAMLGRDEAAVRRALDAIEQTNTAALSDMRRLLAVLRDTERPRAGPDRTAAEPGQPRRPGRPGPGRRATGGGRGGRRAGRRTARRRPVGLPDRPGGADQRDQARRRRSTRAGARGLLPRRPARSTVDRRRPRPRLRRPTAAGTGLVGIRERVAVVGGRVHAGPAPAGGFVVSAQLPYALEATP